MVENIEFIMGSIAIPGIFPYVNYQNMTFVDGGTTVRADVVTGVQKCHQRGFQDSDIIVDTLLNFKGIKIFKSNTHFLISRNPL
jgi:hypothetical protein